MIFGALNRLAKSNPTLARGGGYLLGYLAASPLRHPFAALAALSIGGEYLKRKRKSEASAAARKAAVMVGKTDPACADPNAPDCIDHARAAAIEAGQAALRGDRRLPVPLAILLACATFVGVLILFKLTG